MVFLTSDFGAVFLALAACFLYLMQMHERALHEAFPIKGSMYCMDVNNTGFKIPHLLQGHIRVLVGNTECTH